MTDEKYTPEVGAWLKGREVSPPDSGESARQVAARLPQVRQRRRWWPMKLFDRNAEPSTTTQAADRQPAPVTGSISNSTTAASGARSIFSAASFVVAAVVVALFGGYLVMSVMTQPPGDGSPAAGGTLSTEAPSSVESRQAPEQEDGAGPDPVPSPKEDDVKLLKTPLATALAIGLLASPAATAVAQDVDMTPASVTGTTTVLVEENTGSRAWIDGAIRGEGLEFSSTWEASDPRLSGDFSATMNRSGYDQQEMAVFSGIALVENDQGRWIGTGGHLGGAELGETTTLLMLGEDAYAGLTAYVVVDNGVEPPTFAAAVFPGDAPAYPEEE
jgi:hypothetical protein